MIFAGEACSGACKLDSMKALLTISLVAFAWCSTANADVPETQQAEVDYLLNTLETSDCQMIRNGKSHSGAEGAKHARRKYNYFRDAISSTEEFIEYSASRSTMSGKPYRIECPGEEPVTSQDWLLARLSEYRTVRN
jgi:hypothetical protein